MLEPPPQAGSDLAPEPLTGTRPALLMLAGLAASFALFVWGRLWIIPPVLPYTPLVYLLFWVPMLVFLDPTRRPGTRLWLLITVLAMAIIPCCCIIYAPTSGLGVVFEAWTVECQKLDSGGGQARYLCRSASYRMEFTGPTWSPLVRLTELEGYDSVSPPPLPTLTPAVD